MLSLGQSIHIINQSTYKLDAIGVVGLFGGDRAADALETIHLYPGRRWAGWYNYPGAMTVATRFGQMARSRFWDTIFPGLKESPSSTFKLAGQPGPDCFGVFSRFKWSTGYAGHLIAKESHDLPDQELPLFKEDGRVGRSSFNPGVVTIISLSPKPEEGPAIILNSVSGSGFSSLVLGSAKLTLGIHLPLPPVAPSTPGDGLMFPTAGHFIVIKGKEADVRAITGGELKLEYANWVRAGGMYHTIGISSLLLVAQVFVQFVLLPRCTFFGQILTLLSFLTSAMYHLYVVSVSPDSKRVHWEALKRTCGYSLRMEKWSLGTRTQMTVFVCLVLAEGAGRERRIRDMLESHSDAVLICNIPIKAAIWEYWRRKVVTELLRFLDWNERLAGAASQSSTAGPDSSPYMPNIKVEPEDDTEKNEYAQFTEQDKERLGDLIDDAWCVFSGYPKWRDDKSVVFRD